MVTERPRRGVHVVFSAWLVAGAFGAGCSSGESGTAPLEPDGGAPGGRTGTGAFACPGTNGAGGAPAVSGFVVCDRFGRVLNDVGLTLVDWEGQLANPTVELTVVAPPSLVSPANVTVSAGPGFLFFDGDGTLDAAGPSRPLGALGAGNAARMHVSVWSDHDTTGEAYTLAISGGGVTTTVPVRIVDQDREPAPGSAAPFRITLDDSQDSDGFLLDPARRQIVEIAAADWAYFFDDMHLDTVETHTQETDCWTPAGWRTDIWNTAPYTGFLLYAYGVHTTSTDLSQLHSGGAASSFPAYQSSGGARLPALLRRSGTIDLEEAGNYTPFGWLTTAQDADWWRSANLDQEPTDFLSVVHHEIGHALVFHPNHPLFGAYHEWGAITEARVTAYFGRPVPIDADDHLTGAVDPASLIGGFGSEYAHVNRMQPRRWIITKLDLLCAQAIGYQLRPSSAFAPLAIVDAPLPPAVTGASYEGALAASGGGPPTYRFTIAGGALPPGLALDSFSGRLSGVPTRAGRFAFAVAVSDIGTIDVTATRDFEIVVE